MYVPAASEPLHTHCACMPAPSRWRSGQDDWLEHFLAPLAEAGRSGALWGAWHGIIETVALGHPLRRRADLTERQALILEAWTLNFPLLQTAYTRNTSRGSSSVLYQYPREKRHHHRNDLRNTAPSLLQRYHVHDIRQSFWAIRHIV